MRPSGWLSAALFCCASVVARADVMYSYVGQNFTTVFGDYTTSDHVSGTFTLAEPLAPNLSFDSSLISAERPTDWNFTDGIQIATPDTSGFQWYVSTDALGAITEYLILIDTHRDGEISAENYKQCPYCGDSGGFRDLDEEQYGANEVSGRLTQISTVTPEPSSFALLGSGVLGAAGLVRRRLAQGGKSRRA